MKKSRTVLSLAMLALAGSTMLAADMKCSLRPQKGANKADLAAMAKVSQDDAQRTALTSLKDSSKATVKEAELEAENGCLVYSFDIAVEGRRGIQEVQVDAGNGKVLSSKHESPKAEAREQAKDKARTPGPK
jgi:uncharacterized membrane protein YkoI